MNRYWAGDLIARKGIGAGDVSSLACLVVNLTKAARFAADNDRPAKGTMVKGWSQSVTCST